MARTDPRSKLSELHEAAERISANLVELEIDSSRRLLDSGTLTGQSAARWSRANAALTELWRRLGLLEALLQEADKLRGPRRADQLATLLNGPSIEVTNAEVPIGQRDLLGGSTAAQRCSPDQLLSGMAALFDEVKAVIVQIAQAWETLLPRLDRTCGVLDETNRLAAGLGKSSTAEVDAVSAQLAELSAGVTNDPLSARAEEIDRIERTLEALRDELHRTAELQRGFEAKIVAARELLDRIRAAIGEATAARSEVLIKISMPGTPETPKVDEALERQLTPIANLAQAGRWRDARRALDRFNQQAEAQLDKAITARAANRAPIDARNQFRALLEAYQVKAKRLGRLEDPELQRILQRARDTLYTAPTDLALAAQLVRSYQQALSPAPAPETSR